MPVSNIPSTGDPRLAIDPDHGGAPAGAARTPASKRSCNGKPFYAKVASRRVERSVRWSPPASAALIGASPGRPRALDLSEWPPLSPSGAAFPLIPARMPACGAPRETAGASDAGAAARVAAAGSAAAGVSADAVTSTAADTGTTPADAPHSDSRASRAARSHLSILRDFPVPTLMRMGHLPYVDLNGNMNFPGGYISQTETVWTAYLILGAIQLAPIPANGDLQAASYFDVSTESGAEPLGRSELTGPSADRRDSDKAGLEKFRDSLDLSPTFRGLLRVAIHRGCFGVAGQDRWTLVIAPPVGKLRDTFTYPSPCVKDWEKRQLYVHPYESESIAGKYYLYRTPDGEDKQERLGPMRPDYSLVRALVRLLTERMDATRLEPWVSADGHIIPEQVAELGVAERGVDYLAERVLRELDPDADLLLSPLPFTEANMATPPGRIWPAARLDEAMSRALDRLGGIEQVKRYVQWQDEFIEAQFPLKTV